jgi:hypothetical protein
VWARLWTLGAVTLVATVAGCVGAVPTSVSPEAVASAANGNSSQVFVQVSSLAPTYSPAAVGSWMGRVCAGRDVVLQDVASSDGVLKTAYLDVIAPYLPGGARACFRRAFVGTVDLPWTGAGSKYVEGIESSSFREQNLALSKSVAQAFVARYRQVKINWYLTYEADLNQLYYPSVQQGYVALLSGEMQALAALRPRARFSWSPAFWYPYSVYSTNTAGMTQLRSMLVDLFSRLRAASGGVQLLDLQDFVAGSACQPPGNRMTPSDVVGWTGFLASLQQVPDLEINVEQYAVNCSTGGAGPGDPYEVANREAFYAAHGVKLGPSFEVRYWMPLHGFAL